MDRSSKQNINKDIVEWNDTLDQKYLADIYRTFHPKEAKYTFFSNAYRIFSKIDHMIGHRTSINKIKKIEIISSTFLYHKSLKLESNLKEKTQKHSNSWGRNRMLFNNEWINNDIKEEIKNLLEINENEHTTTQDLWDTRRAVLTGKFIATQAYLKKDRNISNKQPNPMPTRTVGTTNKTQSK